MSAAAFLHDGNTINWVNNSGGTLTLGTINVIGNLIGLLIDCGMGSSGPATTLANGATGRVLISGVVQGVKVSGSGGAVIEGQAAFWDVANARFTPVPAGNRYAGVFAKADTQASATCFVKLNANAEANAAGAQQLIAVGPVDAAANGDNAFFTVPAGGSGYRLVNWHIRAKDTGAANVKLRYGTTDVTGVTAKGVTNDALVAGASIVEAQKVLAAGTVLLINLSAAQSVEVTAYFVKA